MKARADATSFRLKLSALTPFISGSGRILNRYDTILTMNPRSGSPLIRVIDTERFIAEAKLTPDKKIEAIEKRQSGSLDRFSRYILSCAFREHREGIELVEFNHDAAGLPVVPASALRGLLRTAVAFACLRADEAALRAGVEGAMEGRWRREGAAGKLERALFGRSQEDLFGAVEMSEPKPVSNEDLKAYEVAVMNLMGTMLRQKMALHVEGLSPGAGVSFEFPVKVDRARLGEKPEAAPPRSPAAHLRGRDELLAALRAFSEAIIEGERRFYADVGAQDMGRLFDDAMRRAAGRIALPFGFGGGWRGKTVGALLDPAELNRLAPLLSPGRSFYRRGPRPLFPKTRRWVLDRGRPSEPLGWIAIE